MLAGVARCSRASSLDKLDALRTTLIDEVSGSVNPMTARRVKDGRVKVPGRGQVMDLDHNSAQQLRSRNRARSGSRGQQV
jgi:hypothetical protein